MLLAHLSFLALLNAIACACLGSVTLLPELLLRVPALNSRITAAVLRRRRRSRLVARDMLSNREMDSMLLVPTHTVQPHRKRNDISCCRLERSELPRTPVRHPNGIEPENRAIRAPQFRSFQYQPLLDPLSARTMTSAVYGFLFRFWLLFSFSAFRRCV